MTHCDQVPQDGAVQSDPPPAGKKKRGKKSQVSDKLHTCNQCPYTCNRADKLRVHVKGVHNNDKPFLCTFCFKGFKQRDKVS